MKKGLIIAAVVIILAALAGYFYMHNQAKAPTTVDGSLSGQNQQSQSNPVPSQNQTATSSGSQININGSLDVKAGTEGGETAAPNIQVVEVDFDGSQFTPATVNIKAGDYVFFKNKSTVDFWPASDPHPTHTDYPGFDALHNIAPGGEYKFQFTKIGSWGYHDHLAPFIRGTVNVAQ